MKSKWEIKTISQIGKVFNGNSINEEYKKTHYANLLEGIPFLATKDIGYDSTITYDNGIKIPFNQKDKFKIAPANTALICAEGGSAGRKYAITNQEVCFGNKLFALVPFENINSKYIYYYYQSAYFQNSFLTEVKGIIGGVSMSRFKGITIPVPSLSEQQQIIEKLDTAFDLIDRAKANIEKNILNAKELFQSKLNQVFSEDIDGRIKVPLSDVLMKTQNINPKDFDKREFKYIDVSAVNRYTLQIEEYSFINASNAPSRARKHILENDVIFATVRPTLKRVCLISKDYNDEICSTGYVVLRNNPKIILPEIIFYFLQTTTFMDAMEKLQKGASYPAVNDNDVKSQTINFHSSFQNQQKIVSQLDNLSSQIKLLQQKYQQKLANLEELKKSILEKAFKGELVQ